MLEAASSLYYFNRQTRTIQVTFSLFGNLTPRLCLDMTWLIMWVFNTRLICLPRQAQCTLW
ncbi:hypothetical protein DPMN_074585 [Dreissena polymorpha]|uniref:Uncharacterized protein n=1 Tax=Dreissena polymorpha TaxID=45954 RepID=A0A9D3YJK0_DREPO|nr:hypothetical protein DPMN_074585 [Dreissena polymorpha]